MDLGKFFDGANHDKLMAPEPVTFRGAGAQRVDDLPGPCVIPWVHRVRHAVMLLLAAAGNSRCPRAKDPLPIA